MIAVRRRPRPVALDDSRLEKLSVGLGRCASFYVVGGRLFFSDGTENQEFDALGLVIEFSDRGANGQRAERSFHYLSARFGYEDSLDRWLRRFVLLDRLPIGLVRHFSGTYGSLRSLSQVLDGSGNQKLIAVDIDSEGVDESDDGERPTPIKVDRRLSFVFEGHRGLSVETGGGSASAPLYISRAAERPLGRSFTSLTLRAGLRAPASLNIH